MSSLGRWKKTMFMSLSYLRYKNILNIYIGDGGLASSSYSNSFVCKEPSYTFPAVPHEFNSLRRNSLSSLRLVSPAVKLVGL